MTDPTLDDIRTIIQSMKHVAVLGAHEKHERPAHYVPQALFDGGIHITPVNQRFKDQTLWGQRVLQRLDEIEHPIDVVDVFRRADVLPMHVEEILNQNPHTKVVWLQKGIRNDDFAAGLRKEGITVVQDRCLMVDFRAMRTP